MKNTIIRNWIMAIVVIAVVATLAALSDLFRTPSVAPQAQQTLSPERMQTLIPRGRELTSARDCFGCHSIPQGPMGAGSLAIATPSGTLCSTNITPDKQYGIGNCTRADFHRVMRDGITPGERNLHPAMPPIFSHITTPDDIDALYAHNMSIPAMSIANKSNTGVFALPVRLFMDFRTLLNFPDRKVLRNDQRSAEWNRGAYLVEKLAHCGSCHLPRNFMMGVEFSRSLQGGEVDGVVVPDITAAVLAKRGFDVPTLSTYLTTGMAPQGTSFDSMHTVTHFSTSAMEPEDVKVVAIYLPTGRDGKLALSVAPPISLPQAAVPKNGTPMAAGRLAYMASCADCHGMEGEGIPNVSPAMKGNTALAMDSLQTIINVVLNGIPTQVFKNGERIYVMPPFVHRLNAPKVADLVIWTKAEQGGQTVPVTVEQVSVQEIVVK